MGGIGALTAAPARRILRRGLRPTLRLQLTLLYGGFFCAAGAAVLAVPIFTIRSQSRAGATAPEIAFMNSSIRTQEIRALVILVFLVAASLVVGWLIAGRLLRPLRAITATAREISASDLNRRLDPGVRGNEFADLAQTLNDLLARLGASFESQRRFVANASHELRTPLSAGRALLQVALADPDADGESLRATCEEVLALGEQQERLIGALLTLATGQRGLDRSEPVDLADIASGVLAARRHEAEGRGVQVRATIAAAPTAGDPRLIESLVANLVDNAIRHNHPGGRAEISTARTEAGAVIAVGNTGPVIPPDEVGGLFEPFRQLGAQRVRHGDGHGLGLAIVRAIADAHGAAVTARARPGGGLDVEALFPAAGPNSSSNYGGFNYHSYSHHNPGRPASSG